MRLFFEKIPKPPNASFACLNFQGKAFHCPYHQHPELEILHIEKSSGRTVIGDRPGTFQPGQFYLFGPQVPHMFLNSGGDSEARSRVVQFLPDCLGADFWNLPETRAISQLFGQAGRGLLWEGQEARAAIGLLDAVFADSGASRIARLLVLLEFLSAARTGKSLASAGYLPTQKPVDSDRLGRVLDYVDQKLSEGIDADEAARKCGLSVSGFGRFFRRHMGCAFVAYLTARRIAEARRLLIETDLTVAEICFRSGFGNLSNFNRHFLASCGQPPASWRRDIVGRKAEAASPGDRWFVAPENG